MTYARESDKKEWAEFGGNNRNSYLCTAILHKTHLLTNLTYYESIRNRFHFDSRFV